MILPLRTDRRLQGTPWVNIALIAANVLVFLWVNTSPAALKQSAAFWLYPGEPRLFQFLSYQFLHEGFMHLAGNMVFLYVFGNSVEDRLGKLGYAAFYLAGGVLAGLAQCALSGSNAPTLGASGAIAAVTGAYLALFPASNVTVGYMFYYVGMFEVSSLYLILFQIGQNVVMLGLRGEHVAYLAHLGGYAYGFLIGMTMLWTRLLPREPYDLLSMIAHRRRRMKFAAITREGYHPWEGAGGASVGTRDASPMSQEIMALRDKISRALELHQTAEAAGLYRRLLAVDENQALASQAQLDVANQFASEGDYETAARAYELFLNVFRGDAQRDQVQLILALIYARYLKRLQRSRELITAALPRLHDPQQRELAEQTLAMING